MIEGWAMVSITVIISACSLLIAAVMAVVNIRSTTKKADTEETTKTTTLIVKLENISDGVNEIKTDMKNFRSDLQNVRERLTIVEQSTKSAHKRLDQWESEQHEK